MPNPDLKPEESTSFDIGLERQLSDVLNLQMTVFSQTSRTRSMVLFSTPSLSLLTAENIPGTSKRSGLEVGSPLGLL